MPILMAEQLAEHHITWEQLLYMFMGEGNRLVDFARAVQLSTLIPQFYNYPKLVRARYQRGASRALVHSLSGGTGVITCDTSSRPLRELLASAHLAACCELFAGDELHLHGDFRANIEALVQAHLAPLRAAPMSLLAQEVTKLHRADAIRCLEVLHLLNLTRPFRRNVQLLSVGSGPAQREMFATHVDPMIEPAATALGRTSLRLGRRVSEPEHLVLIDSDPFWRLPYEALNAELPHKVTAINASWETALNDISRQIAARQLSPRNLILIWRMEPLAFPDESAFFSTLAGTIAGEADFIVSVGAGNSEEEFTDRRNTMNTFFAWLKGHEMQPTRIVLHRGSRSSLLFGDLSYATYELVHCRLARKKLGAVPGQDT